MNGILEECMMMMIIPNGGNFAEICTRKVEIIEN